jgi:hypothetical protein
MKSNYLKEYYKNKLMNLIFEAAPPGPPVPWQPPEEQPNQFNPNFNPDVEWEIDPDDVTPQRPEQPINPHSPVFRPNGINPNQWHLIPNSNPPTYYHDLGNGYGQGYRWNPDAGRWEPHGSPQVIPQSMPGGLPTPTGIPVPNGGQVYTDPNGNLYLRDPNGTIYYWDSGTNRWVEITDPSYLPTKPVWRNPNAPGPGGTPNPTPGFIPNPMATPNPSATPSAPSGPRPGFGRFFDRFRGRRPLP